MPEWQGGPARFDLLHLMRALCRRCRTQVRASAPHGCCAVKGRAVCTPLRPCGCPPLRPQSFRIGKSVPQTPQFAASCGRGWVGLVRAHGRARSAAWQATGVAGPGVERSRGQPRCTPPRRRGCGWAAAEASAMCGTAFAPEVAQRAAQRSHFVPPTNNFLVRRVLPPRCFGTAALASMRRPRML
jgi:hypothetical protein